MTAMKATGRTSRSDKRTGLYGLKGSLIKKSMDAFVLSLETFNRLSVKYRVEAFLILLCNAWELLLKARLIDLNDGNRECIYREPAGAVGEYRATYSLVECLGRVFPDDRDAIRKNLENVAKLRNACTHFVLPGVPREILELLQAAVLNYNNKLSEWSHIRLSERIPAGMMTLVYEADPDRVDLSGNLFRRQLSKETLAYLTAFQERLLAEHASLDHVKEFAACIEFKVAMTRTAKGADASLLSGPDGRGTGIIGVPRDASETHPWRLKELLEELRRRESGRAAITAHEIVCVVDLWGFDKRPEFFYRSRLKGAAKQYSPAFLEALLAEVAKDPLFLEKARSKYKVSAQRARAGVGLTEHGSGA